MNTYRIQLITALALLIGGFAFLYFFTGVFGSTAIGVTIKTNADITDGLVGHWTFDGKDMANGVVDSSGQGHTALLKVGASGNNTSTTTVPGRIGQAIDFDGTDDWVDVDTPAELDSSTAKSFAVWVYPRTLGGGNFGTMYAAGINGDKMYFTFCNSNGTECPSRPSTFVFNNRDSGGIQSNEWTAPANTIQLNRWQHLVVTYNCDGSSAKFYYNGEEITATQVITHSSGCPDSSSLTKYIGYTTNSGFDGLMDDFRVYNRVLSADEVKRIYELGATTHVATTITTNPDLQNGLVGHWTFDGKDMINNVADTSGSGNTGFLDTGGEATSTKAARGVIGQAFDFDGSNDAVIIGDSASLSASPSGAETWAAWIYPRTLGGGNFGVIYATPLAANNSYLSLCSSNGFECPSAANTFVFNHKDNSGVSWNEWYAPANTIKLNQWQFIVVTYPCDGSSAKFYYNGQAITATKSRSGAASCFDESSNTYSHYIGFATNSGFDGMIDDVRVYNRVLSADEVERLYQLGR